MQSDDKVAHFPACGPWWMSSECLRRLKVDQTSTKMNQVAQARGQATGRVVALLAAEASGGTEEPRRLLSVIDMRYLIPFPFPSTFILGPPRVSPSVIIPTSFQHGRTIIIVAAGHRQCQRPVRDQAFGDH